ncbi:MAG: transglycosylase SLT domain-containing protein [Schleiferiaceae bacterium]
MMLRVLFLGALMAVAAPLRAESSDTTALRFGLATKVDTMYAKWALNSSQRNWVSQFKGPVDSLAGASLGVSDDVLKQRLAVLDKRSPMDLRYTPDVRNAVAMYVVRKKDLVARVMGRGRYYFPIFEAALDRYNLPLELRALPMIESALNPLATSPAGAKGLWQFMYATGKLQGLEIGSYVDERSDPVKSTDAACRYLKRLYDMFGNWELALAAYNAGPGNVSKAIRASGGKTTYWEVRPYLPRETRMYVPNFIAANYALAYGGLHGIRPDLPPATFFDVDTVNVTSTLDLNVAAAELGVDTLLMKGLNPMYKLHVVPAPRDGKMYPLVLPRAAVASFQECADSAYLATSKARVRAEIPEQTVSSATSTASTGSSPKRHTVRSGETLSTIARKYGVKVSDIQRWNGLRGTTIQIGQRLIVKK